MLRLLHCFLFNNSYAVNKRNDSSLLLTLCSGFCVLTVNCTTTPMEGGSLSKDKDYSAMKQPEFESCGVAEIDNGEYWPISGKPYVDMIITKTAVKPCYNLYLPKKMTNELPSAGASTVVTCGQKKWDMIYGGIKSNNRFTVGWREFVEDNNIKEGDGLVLELSECSVSKIHFRVQILKGDFPAELIPENEEGTNSNNPILVG